MNDFDPAQQCQRQVDEQLRAQRPLRLDPLIEWFSGNKLHHQVAIKQYLPSELALRCDDQSIRSKSDRTLEKFNWGRTRFLDESRTLASFRHPNMQARYV